MDTIIILLIIGAAVGASACPDIHTSEKVIFDLRDSLCLFRKYLKEYEIAYDGPEETALRYDLFISNLRLINALNMEKGHKAYFGITKFAGLAKEEFKAKYLGFRPSKTWSANVTMATVSDVVAPFQFDWRTKGAVTPIKNQLQCGSCWAFSVIAVLESMAYIKYKKLVPMSEQQVVDCDTQDAGCNGGLPQQAFRYLRIGAMTEEDYPYTSQNGQCHFDPSKKVYAAQTAEQLPTEEAAKQYISEKGPISAALNAERMQHYRGGVDRPSETQCDPDQVDHAITIVGYGVEEGTDFWIIKNSWGTTFGEKGYYRLQRGIGACGIERNLIGCSVQ